MHSFNLLEYKQFLEKQLRCRATYKDIDITDILLESLYQFTKAPSSYLKHLPQIVVSRKHRHMFDVSSKPTSVQVNTWFLYQFAYKYCRICEQVQHIDKYTKDYSKWDSLQPVCAICSNKQNADFKVNNPEYTKNYQKHNSEKIKQYKKDYRLRNADKLKDLHILYYLANSDKIKEYNYKYRLNNLDKHAAKNAKRRAKKLKATPNWLTTKQLLDIKAFYTEAKRLEKETGVKYHVDHIVPLQGLNVCGLHVPWNLQVITAKENNKKYNKYSL